MVQSMKSEAAPQVAVAPGELNQGCLCITLDRDALRHAFEEETGDPDFCVDLLRTRPHLFANVAVFVSADTISQMHSVVRIIESVSALPAYREAALAWAPTAARFDPGPVGAFMGYDFHVTSDGPKLIEINTNAGGAFLTAPLARAQKRCCEAAAKARSPANADGFDAASLRMFEAEWHLQGRAGLPGRVAIVDDDPQAQFLYPEFILAQRFFAKHGIEAVVADGKDLAYGQGVLTCGGAPIDLVYNRLVDFSFDRPDHASLRAAYLDEAVVVTPNPRAHALFADKRNLTLLSDRSWLERAGVTPSEIETLTTRIPETQQVTAENASALWAERKRFFFKPAGGHGSKAAYRGSKLTKSVWADIVTGTHVAQAFAAPGARTVRVDASPETLKVDLRLYTYAGEILLVAARLYQGQTTNMRTPGGGFAAVFQIPAGSSRP